METKPPSKTTDSERAAASNPAYYVAADVLMLHTGDFLISGQRYELKLRAFAVAA